MVFILKMIVNQDILWSDGGLGSGIHQMGGNALTFQHDSGSIDTKSGGTIGLSENVFVPYYRGVGTILSGEVQMHFVVLLVTTQAHYYGRNVLYVDIQLG